MVIPYLELSAKQEYLVQRIKGDLWIVCVSHVMYWYMDKACYCMSHLLELAEVYQYMHTVGDIV